MGKHTVLHLLRVIIEMAVFTLLTWLFVDYGMTVPSLAAKLAKVQLLPAAMAFAMTVFIIWLIVTLVFGRIYCSTVCPLGAFQDIMARLPRLGRRVGSRWHYHYSPALTGLRFVSLFIVVLSIVLGISAVTMLLDPFSIYGRFASDILKPLWGYILNVWNDMNSLPQVKITVASVLGLVIATVTMLVVGALAFKNGRTFCNTVCPVGTTLSFISRYSVFRIDIDTDKCIQCRKCEHRCKASCIDMESHVVDTSRCVVCFDCLSDCPNDAIRYTFNRHQLSIPLMQRVKDPVAGSTAGMDIDRRRFITVGAIAAASPLIVKGAKVAGKVAVATASRLHRNLVPVAPPGARTRREFLDRCTGCGLCVDRCPQKVLKVSLDEYGLLRALHPVMDYDASWCVYDCTLCSNLCPTNALSPLTISEKHLSRVGLACVDIDLCISYSEGVSCGACSRRCPTGAISMVSSVTSGHGPHPSIDASKCVGCGSCQYVCPARPKAIKVGGID